MKNLKNLISALLVTSIVGTSTVSFASSKTTTQLEQTAPVPDLGVTFGQMKKSKLDVMIASVPDAQMTIHLFDPSGRIIVTKNLAKSKQGALVRFDMTALSDGLYRVQVTDGKTTQQQQLELKTVPAKEAFKQLSIM